MSADANESDLCLESREMALDADEIVELSLLLPNWQMAALETAAHDQGLTMAQMVRQIISDYFTGLPRKRLGYQVFQSLS